MTHDDEGRLFYNHNSTWLIADFYPADPLLRAGVGEVPPGLGELLLPDAEVFGIRVSPGVNRAYLPGVLREDGRLRTPTAVSGLEAYRGDQFPGDMARPHPLFDGLIGVGSPFFSAVRNARLAFTWSGDTFHEAVPLTPREAALRERGRAFYQRVCASCHHARGSGVAGLAPPLQHAPWVNAAAEVPARILLDGMRGELTIDGRTWNAIMPGHGGMPELMDEVAAGVLTYIRTAWGNRGGAVAPEFVRKVREDTAGRGRPWTAAELAPYLDGETQR